VGRAQSRRCPGTRQPRLTASPALAQPRSVEHRLEHQRRDTALTGGYGLRLPITRQDTGKRRSECHHADLATPAQRPEPFVRESQHRRSQGGTLTRSISRRGERCGLKP